MKDCFGKSGKAQEWNGDKNLSVSLGNNRYPLFKFCYNYIWKQVIRMFIIPM